MINPHLSSVLHKFWIQNFETAYYQQQITLKKYSNNKYIYRNQDSINYIYILIQGEITIIYQEKQLVIQPFTIFGDFQPSINVHRRITKAKTSNRSTIAVLQYDTFFNIKRSVDEKLLPILNIRSQFLKYTIKKLFQFNHTIKNQIIKINNGFGVILMGLFQLKKNINAGKFRHRVQEGGYEFSIIKRHHSIGQLHQNQIFVEDLVCQSNKGLIAYCNHKNMTFLRENFQQFQGIYQKAKQRMKYHYNKMKDLQNAFQYNQHLKTSIFPYSTPNRDNSPQNLDKFRRYQTQISSVQSLIKKRSGIFNSPFKSPKLTKSLQAKMVKKIDLQNEQVFDQNGLILFFKKQQIRKKKLSLQLMKTPSLKLSTKKYFNDRKVHLYTQSDSSKLQKLQIPSQFKQTKFKLRMFLKMRKKMPSGFQICQQSKTFKNSILFKKPNLLIKD